MPRFPAFPRLAPNMTPQGRHALAEHASLGLFAVVWIFVVLPATGGLHDRSTALGVLAAVPALLLTRPWQNVGRMTLSLLACVAGGGLLVLTVTPPGWAQADSVAAHLAGGLAFVVVAAYARSAERRLAVVIVLVLALLFQFTQAWLPWWGGADPNKLLVGTFYWHNPLGAYFTGLGLLAGAVAVLGRAPVQRPAFLTAPFAAVGVILSTSRASLALLVLGWLGVGLLAGTATPRLPALLRWLAVPVATGGLLAFLTSGVFFPGESFEGPAAAATTSNASSPAGERGLTSLSSSGVYRVEWADAAVQAWLDKPLLGQGFGSFAATSPSRLPEGTPRSLYVHNAYVEALTAGGLVFGGPVTLAALTLLLMSARAGWRALRSSEPDRALTAGAALATGALLAHAGVDFDWHYPTLLVLVGVTGGIVCAAAPPTRRRATRAGIVLPVLSAVVALAVLATYAEAHGRLASNVRDGPTATRATRLLDSQWPLTRDSRIVLAALRASIVVPRSGPDRLSSSDQVARQVLRESADLATIDDDAALLRAEVQALAGQPAEAAVTAERILARTPGARLARYPTYLQIAAAGRRYEPARLAALTELRATTISPRSQTASWRLVATMLRLDGRVASDETLCAYATAENAYGQPPVDLDLPAVTPDPAC